MSLMGDVPGLKSLSTGRVASLAGVALTTVRFYERANIVRPVGRSGANYRLYSPDAVTRIRFTRRAQELGFTLREVKSCLLYDRATKAIVKRFALLPTPKLMTSIPAFGR